MENFSSLAKMITGEANNPTWGQIFLHVLANKLTLFDIEKANEIWQPHPQWIDIIAGGNEQFLDVIAEYALTDFLVEKTINIETMQIQTKGRQNETFAAFGQIKIFLN